MHLIFICDDDLIFAGMLKKRVGSCMDRRQKKYEIRLFTNGMELLEDLEEDTPEMIFLDIDMPEISGMDLADRIFQSAINTNVIFVTNRDDLVFQAIRYQPFRFIRKEKLDEELEEAVDQLLDKVDRDEKILELQTKDGGVVLSLKEILYIESSKHYLLVHHRKGCCETRGKISDYETWITDFGFVKTHRSYLVNIRYIKAVRAAGVELDNGEILPVSRDRLQEIKKQHMVFLRSFTYANN